MQRGAPAPASDGLAKAWGHKVLRFESRDEYGFISFLLLIKNYPSRTIKARCANT